MIWLSWIRNENPDPDSGAWTLTKIIQETWFPAFQNRFCTLVGMLFDFLAMLSIFFM
jgi:hypothetical protein